MNETAQKENVAGIMAELLKTPVFKDLIRGGARSLAHGDGSGMVRTLMGQDPETFLTLVAAVPSMANVLIGAAQELGTQLKNQYPPHTLAPFLESMLGEIDTASLARCGTVWAEILASLLKASPDAAQAITDRLLSSGPGWTARGIDAATRALNRLEENRPGAVSTYLSHTLGRVNRPAASSALGIVAGAVLDQKWHAISWLFFFVRERIRKRFRS